MAEKPQHEQMFRSAPGFFPTANVPVWVTMHPDADAESLAVAQFIVAYRNSADGSLPRVGRTAILNRFGRKKDWLDRRVNRLEQIGFLSRVPMYEDAHTKERTPDKRASDGTLNPQTSNDWLVHDQPPSGDFHPHPIQSSEFERPDRVHARIERRARLLASIHRGGGATQRPGGDQEKQEFSQLDPQALHSAPGGRYTAPRTKSRGTRTTNQPTPEAVNDDGGSMDGWLGSTTDGEKATGQPAPSNGRLLLQRQGVTGRALDEWAGVVDEAISQLGVKDTRSVLTDNLGSVNNPAGVIVARRLPDLRERISAASAAPPGGDGAQQQSEIPPWCGKCDDEGRDKPAHRRIEIDGSIRRCPNCHPNPNPNKTKSQNQGSGRSQEEADKQLISQLLGQ